MTRSAARLLICSVFAAGCGDDGGNADAGVGTPPPPISTPTTSGAPSTTTEAASTSTTGTVQGCGCADGQFCAAPHVGGVSDPDDPSLQFTCQESCVPEADPNQWCSQDFPSCCDGLPCTDDGFCGGNGLGTGAPATSTTGGSSSGGSSSGGSTDSGSSGGSTGATATSSTGAATGSGTGGG